MSARNKILHNWYNIGTIAKFIKSLKTYLTSTSIYCAKTPMYCDFLLVKTNQQLFWVNMRHLNVQKYDWHLYKNVCVYNMNRIFSSKV